MMDWTDRHCRYFLRLISRRCRLYTEMITTGSLLFGNVSRQLDFDPAEHPIALQLGGSDPKALAHCARLGEAWGYDEINLNVGCPSERVQTGSFGAGLMAEPLLVAECIAAIREAVALPVTVKHRVGINTIEDYAFVHHFVASVAQAGATACLVHARNAILKGLSPKQNRELPPLKYDYVHRLKRDFPDLTIVINGGIVTRDAIARELEQVDGVMIGRGAYHNPWLLSEADRYCFAEDHGEQPRRSRAEVVEALVPYTDAQLAQGVRLRAIARHVLGLYHGEPGARAWRRMLSDEGLLKNMGSELFLRALREVEPEDVLADSG
jgi:tRNA-dihydrouridine synthase A